MSRRILQINRDIIGTTQPRPRTIRQTKLSDYPTLSAAHRQIAKSLSSPWLLGPPICDELMAVVEHLFTPAEAEVVQYLGGMIGKTAGQIARAMRRPLEGVELLLRNLAFKKRAIAASGAEGHKKYKLAPLMPGIFEMVLISEHPETISPWHRRFAELFEALYETGYLADYGPYATPFVRFLPLGQFVKAHPAALPSDQLEVVLDRYKTFAIGQCQCRTTMAVVGKSCGKPIGNCCVIGEFAEAGIRNGTLKPVTKQAMLEIKAEGEAHGMVSWIMNVESSKGQYSCTCCGCCCHALRTVKEFNAPSLAAPPHFLPEFDSAKCSYCAQCARRCPMGAIALNPREKTWMHLKERCIGCGICAGACDQKHAIAMTPVPDYRLPPNSWFALIARTTPSRLYNTWDAWRKRLETM